MKPVSHALAHQFAVTVSVLAGLAAQGVQAPGWVPAPPLPQPLHGIDAAKDPLGRIWVVGGQTAAGTTSNVVYRFDEVSGWQAVATMPTPRSACAVAADAFGRIWVFGGGNPPSSSVDRFDPNTGQWQNVGVLPQTRAEAKAVASPDGMSIFLLGGSTNPGTSTDEVREYDVVTGVPTVRTPMQYPRVYFGAAMGRDGFLYAVGGTAWNSGSPTDTTVERLAPPYTGQWQFVAPLIAHPHHVGEALAGPDGSIFAIGGWNGTFGPLSNAVERYDPATNAWSLCSSYPHAGNNMAAALGNSGRLYVFGGDDGPNQPTALGYSAFPENTGRSMLLDAPPVLGSTALLTMQYPPIARGNIYAFLWSTPPFASAIPISIPGFQWHGLLRTDPFTSIVPFSGVLPPNATSVTHSVLVPPTSSLVGYAWDTQSLDLHFPTSTFAFADNDLTLQVSNLSCRRVGGTLNGQPINATNDTVTVPAGAQLIGSVVVQTNNTMPPSAIAPLGATVNWGNQMTQHWTANPWISTGVNNYTIPVNITVPTQPGVYYMIIGFAGVYNLGQLMSSTHPALSAVWNDGNDVGSDWSSQQLNQALANYGSVTNSVWMPTSTFQSGPQAFTAVSIVVQ